MSKCLHRSTSRESRCLDSGHWLVYVQCVSCWQWLPLGQSDERPVAVEVRAAELAAAGFGDLAPIHKRREEVDGLIAYERNREPLAELRARPMWSAGWLCGAIMFHDREQRDALDVAIDATIRLRGA